MSTTKLIKFEFLDVIENGKLIGGFSVAMQSNSDSNNDFMTNNCHAGNCSTKTCKKHKLKPLQGSNNCGKNCVSSCGKKH